MQDFSLKTRKGPARTASRIARMDNNVPMSPRTLRRKRALERLDKTIQRYQRVDAGAFVLETGSRPKPGAPFTVAQKLERAQVQRAFLAIKPGMGG